MTIIVGVDFFGSFFVGLVGQKVSIIIEFILFFGGDVCVYIVEMDVEVLFSIWFGLICDSFVFEDIGFLGMIFDIVVINLGNI